MHHRYNKGRCSKSERVDGKGVVPARGKNTVNKECNAATMVGGGGCAVSEILLTVCQFAFFLPRFTKIS